MKKFLCYDTNDAASGKIEVDSRGVLKPNSTVPSGSAPYKQLVTDGNGNTKWEDRLAYEETKLTEIVPEATVTFSAMGGLMGAAFPDSFNPEEGVPYRIVWDGETYECFLQPDSGYPVLGNAGIANMGDDTGEPFVMAYNGTAWMTGTADTSTAHIISISGLSEVVKKIDEIYLPENAFLNADFNQTDKEKLDFIKNRTHGIVSKSFTYVHNMSGELNGWQGAYNSQRHFDLVSGAEYHVVGRITITERNQTPVVLNVDSKVTSRVNENSVELVIPGTIVATSNNYTNFRVCKGSFWYSVSSSTTVTGIVNVDLEIGEGILVLDNKYVPKNYRVVFEQTNNNVFQCDCAYSELKDFAVAGYPIYGILLNRIVPTYTYQYNLIMVKNNVDGNRMEFEFATGEGGTTRLYYYENGPISNEAPIG